MKFEFYRQIFEKY